MTAGTGLVIITTLFFIWTLTDTGSVGLSLFVSLVVSGGLTYLYHYDRVVDTLIPWVCQYATVTLPLLFAIFAGLMAYMVKDEPLNSFWFAIAIYATLVTFSVLWEKRDG
jgi:hypothetical protein